VTFPEARLDFDRQDRLGMVEAIWGENKTFEQIVRILQSFERSKKLALVTRLQQKKANKLIAIFKDAKFHSDSGCLTLGDPFQNELDLGPVIILSGGTSDLPVAAEAELALKLHGIKTKKIIDVGVAGLHRLLSKVEELKQSKVIIACAGMEGALPTILTGLIPQPVIGVPVSVGYGVSSLGKTALEGMLASCAPGLVVVNIDNGYGAAMAALRILKCSLTN
tara:strand:- start:4582 stop:5247 length:666 start_codon:yes stop_codon:yes gene_type:complete